MTYEELLRLGIKKANEYNMEEEAVRFLLLETYTGSQASFYTNLKEEADYNIELLFLKRLDEFLINKIPIQHLLGYAYFHGHKFIVNSDVLIPRRETEELVEHIIHFVEEKYNKTAIKVLDLGSGSGCIGLTLKKELPYLDVTLADISEKALAVSKENSKLLNVDVNFIKSNWFNNINEKYDVIVSNPPYIPNDEQLADIVKKEPNLALFGGSKGLDFYEVILKDIKNHIKEKGMLFFEHGYQHKEAIFNLAEKYFKEAKIFQYKDLQNKDRFTILIWGEL